MGSSCSTSKSTSVVQPLHKVDHHTTTPSSKGQKGASCNESRRPSQTEINATNYDSNKSSKGFVENGFSPENTVGVNIKQRKGSETTHEDLNRQVTTLNETNMNMSRTSDVSGMRKLFQYKKGPLIGKGTYGEVYECLNLNTGELLAVKTFKIHGDLHKVLGYIEAMKKEVTQLRSLGHPNIVKYFSADVMEVRDANNQATVDIVLEFVSGGSVRKLLDKFTKLEEKVVGTYIRQVLEGLAYLHQNGIVHRNIKGSNILIDTTGVIKLTDFGCSGRPDRFSEENNQDPNKAAGFPRGVAYWSAPEVVMRKSQGMHADVWGVGCVVLEMLTGLPPWSETTRTMDEFVRQISLGTPPPFPIDISENCRDFLYKTLKFKPEDRPSPLDLLDHPFVREDLQDTSYMEESMNTVQTFQTFTPNRVLDLLNQDKPGEKKYMELKTNNFITKDASGGNISMSNINLGRLASGITNEFSSNTNLLARLDSRDNYARGASFDRERHLGGGHRAGKHKHSGGLVVTEASHQEEFSPVPGGNFQYDFQNPNKSQMTEEQAKEAKRKQLEEEMNRDLMRINTAQLEYDMIEERPDKEETADDTCQDLEVRPKGKRIVPMTNSLVGNSRDWHAEANNLKEKSQLEQLYKPEFKTVGNFMAVPDPKKQDYLDVVEVNSYRSRTADLEKSADKAKNRTNTTPRKKQSEERTSTEPVDVVDPTNEEEVQRQKEKLRRQFEEQMELSLARVNSDKLIQALEASEPSEFTEPKVEGLRKHFEEESSYQFVGLSVDGFRDTWKEEHTMDMEKMTKKKFEENLLGDLKGGEEGDDSMRALGSPQITESDGRSPDHRTKKRQMDVIKFSAEVVINEAEEMKEDSFEGEVSYGKPSSKQHI